MQVTILRLLATATLSLAASPIAREKLPDGAYLWMTHADGSITALPLRNPEAKAIAVAPVKTPTEVEVRGLQKRFVDCWGTPLDHAGVDDAVQQLKDWAGVNGHTLQSPFGVPSTKVSFVSRGMQVYYCINQSGWTGNLDINDVNYALSQMDASCPRYTASYFQWDSPEIVGKANANTPVCCAGKGTC